MFFPNVNFLRALAALLVLTLAALLHDMTRVWLLRPLNYLGEISDDIYLWHLPVIVSLGRSSLASTAEDMLWMSLVGVRALSALTWHLFEKPLIQRFR